MVDAEMEPKVMALEPVLVSCRLCDELPPTRTVPKFRELAPNASDAGLEAPISETNSSEVAELEAI